MTAVDAFAPSISSEFAASAITSFARSMRCCQPYRPYTIGESRPTRSGLTAGSTYTNVNLLDLAPWRCSGARTAPIGATLVQRGQRRRRLDGPRLARRHRAAARRAHARSRRSRGSHWRRPRRNSRWLARISGMPLNGELRLGARLLATTSRARYRLYALAGAAASPGCSALRRWRWRSAGNLGAAGGDTGRCRSGAGSTRSARSGSARRRERLPGRARGPRRRARHHQLWRLARVCGNGKGAGVNRLCPSV